MLELSWTLIIFTILSSFFSSHPLILCLNLIILTLGLSPLMALTVSKWAAYAIILIFLGGMMVLFIYVSTLAGNEKLVFFSGLKSSPALLVFSSFILCMLPSADGSNLLISHFYMDFSAPLLLFFTLYLLFTLIIVIFLSQGFKGALMTHF